jgi:hypothetical protein
LRPKVKKRGVGGLSPGEGRDPSGAAMGELMKLLEKISPLHPPWPCSPLQRLDLDRSLDRCDQEALMQMFRDIGVMAGATEGDFSS